MGDPGSVSTGSLRTKISLKSGGAAYSVVSPFYTMKPELPPKSVLLGSDDLLQTYDLSAAYSRFCGNKKSRRDDLHSFLPHLYGNFNFNNGSDISSLKTLVEKPPITGKDISTLSATAMTGFRLTSGPVDERYRYMFEKKQNDEAFEDTSRSGMFKRSLDTMEFSDDGMGVEKKRHKEDKDKKQKKKKKEKKKKDKKDDEKKHRKSDNSFSEM